MSQGKSTNTRDSYWRFMFHLLDGREVLSEMWAKDSRRFVRSLQYGRAAKEPSFNTIIERGDW